MSSGRRDARALLTSFVILNVTSGMAGGAVQLVVPLYAMHLQATTAQIGLLRGISGLGMLLLVIPAGFLVDHFGSKRLFLTGALAGTLSTLALAFARAPTTLVALMGLSGLFSALKMTALNASFYRNLREMGIEKAGWFKGSMSIGLTFIGPLLGGFLAQNLGHRPIFVLLASLTLVPSALVFFFHSEPVARGAGLAPREAVAAQLREFRALLRRRTLYLPLLAESVSTSCFATFSAFVAVVALEGLSLQPTAASLLLTTEGSVFVVTVFLAGRLLTALSSQSLYVAAFGVTAAGLVAFALAESLLPALAATVVLGLGMGLGNVVTSSRIGQMKGEKGKIVGLFAAAVGAGISLGPILGGLVGQLLGAPFIFLSFVPLFLLLSLLTLVSEPRRAPDRDPELDARAG